MGLTAWLVVLAASAPEVPAWRWGADAQGGAPYVFLDPYEPNRLVGFEVDLAQALAAKLGRRSVPVLGPWDKLLELLGRGDFDAALNGIEVADEKKRVALLSTPYFAAPEVLTVRRGDANAPRTREALRGRPVGTLPGSLAERILKDLGADTKTYEGGQDEIYADLELGRLDAVLLDDPVARYYADVEPSLERVPGDFGHVQYAVALKLGDDAALAAVNQALEQLKADGTLRALYERWGLWNDDVAALLSAPDFRPGHASEWERWRTAVGAPRPFLERVRDVYPGLMPLFAKGAALTLVTSLVAMTLAIAFGLLLVAARRARVKALSLLSHAYVEVFRGTPLLVQLLVIYFGLPELGLKLSPFTAGVLALGLNYAAAEAENYRAGLESVPHGQREAALVLGLSRWQALRHVVAPQAARVAIPPMTNDFIALLKDSSLVSAVTLTELTKTYGSLANSTRDHLGLGLVVALWYLALGLPFAALARRAERYFGRHLAKEPA